MQAQGGEGAWISPPTAAWLQHHQPGPGPQFKASMAASVQLYWDPPSARVSHTPHQPVVLQAGQKEGMLSPSPPQGLHPIKPQFGESWEQLCF